MRIPIISRIIENRRRRRAIDEALKQQTLANARMASARLTNHRSARHSTGMALAPGMPGIDPDLPPDELYERMREEPANPLNDPSYPFFLGKGS